MIDFPQVSHLGVLTEKNLISSTICSHTSIALSATGAFSTHLVEQNFIGNKLVPLELVHTHQHFPSPPFCCPYTTLQCTTDNMNAAGANTI